MQNPNSPLGYSKAYQLLVVPVRPGGEYVFAEARPATVEDLALAGIPLPPVAAKKP